MPTGPAAPSSALGALVAKCARNVHWYLEGMLGADAYKKYLAHHAATHPESPPLTEREYWRETMDWQDRNPQGRCC